MTRDEAEWAIYATVKNVHSFLGKDVAEEIAQQIAAISVLAVFEDEPNEGDIDEED